MVSSPPVRHIIKAKCNERFRDSKGASYITIRSQPFKYVSPLVEDINCYGTHSIKTGAASNHSCRTIASDLLDKHAGWKSPSSKLHYMK